MKNFTTLVLCLLLGTVIAVLASFLPELFQEFMVIANSGARFGPSGWAVFFYIGVLATVAFLAGHGFRILNKKVASMTEDFFRFLD